MALSFDITARNGRARAGVIHTAHGDVLTPSLTLNMTTALDKWGFGPADLTDVSDIAMLRNTFWMREDGVTDVREGTAPKGSLRLWNGPTMADSGGFQMVSLADKLKVGLTGISFDFQGRHRRITPAEVVRYAKSCGVDMIMPLDYVVDTTHLQQWRFVVSAIMTAWWHRLSRGIADGNLYYIVQGGLNRFARDISLRDANRQLRNGIPAVAIGGLAGREERADMYRMIEYCTDRLPDEKPRHMLGVCKPIDLLRAIWLGMDTFDGIAATREGRHGRVWTRGGNHFDIKNAQFADDERVLEEGCQCPVCQSGVSRAELRRQFKAKDREALRALMVHNWYHNYNLVRGAREAIIQNRLDAYIKEYLKE